MSKETEDSLIFTERELSNLQDSLKSFNKCMEEQMPNLQEFSDALVSLGNQFGAVISDIKVPILVLLPEFEDGEPEPLLVNDKCLFNDNNRYGSGFVIGIGQTSYTIKWDEGGYVTVKKRFVRKWSP